jgi:membrane protein
LLQFEGWPVRPFLRRLGRRIREDAVLDQAAQLAFYFLFALFPLLFFIVTLTAYLPLRRPLSVGMRRLHSILPAQVMQLIEDQLHSLLDNPRPKLLTISLLVALWTASRALDGFRKALNLAYRVSETRSFVRCQWLALWTTVVSSGLVLIGFAMIILGGRAGHWAAARVGVGTQFAQVWWYWLRWPSTAVVIMLVAALIFFWLPDVEQKLRFIIPGSLTSTLLWLASTWGFTQYANHVSSFNVTYGSLGTAVVLLTWLYLSALVFLLGGEVNAAFEQGLPQGKRPGARAFGHAPEPGHLEAPPVVRRGGRRRPGLGARLLALVRRSERGERPPPP